CALPLEVGRPAQGACAAARGRHHYLAEVGVLTVHDSEGLYDRWQICRCPLESVSGCVGGCEDVAIADTFNLAIYEIGEVYFEIERVGIAVIIVVTHAK